MMDGQKQLQSLSSARNRRSDRSWLVAGSISHYRGITDTRRAELASANPVVHWLFHSLLFCSLLSPSWLTIVIAIVNSNTFRAAIEK